MQELDGVANVTTWVGSGAPRFYSAARPDLPADATSSQLIVLPKDLTARERCARRCRRCWRPNFPRCAARVKLLPNGPPVAVSGAVPRRRPRRRRVRAYADEVKAIMRAEPEHARRQRQLERIGQGAAARHRPGQGARPRRHQPGDRPGLAHDHSGTTIGQYREGDKLIDIVLRQPLESATRSPTWRTPTCRPPTAAASRCRRSRGANFAWEPGVLWREGRDYAARCRATSSKACRARRDGAARPAFQAAARKMLPATDRSRRRGRGKQQGRRARSRSARR